MNIVFNAIVALKTLKSQKKLVFAPLKKYSVALVPLVLDLSKDFN